MEFTSKTQKKKEATALQKLGERLVELPPEQVRNIDLPAEIYEAVTLARTLKRGGLRRQMQYIGTLMRQYDPGPIKEALHNIETGDSNARRAFREIEKWRDELAAGNEGIMEEILIRFPNADRRLLSQLVRAAREETGNSKPPKASRALFRYLKKLQTPAASEPKN
ncbi:MAG: DUF615 domain-containing protein [Nitrospiraceae bacterium]|nr:MAG: DUF615 domain-containing protein [Nitrospiraceae bacterium]